MKPTLLLLMAAIFVGCAHSNRNSATSEFWFSGGSQTNAWQSRHFDFVGIAKTYAQDKKLDFDFTSAGHALCIRYEDGVAIAQVWFITRPGEFFLVVDIDSSGKVLGHRLRVDKS